MRESEGVWAVDSDSGNLVRPEPHRKRRCALDSTTPALALGLGLLGQAGSPLLFWGRQQQGTHTHTWAGR